MTAQKSSNSLTNRQALYLLYAIQQWMWVEESSKTGGYDPRGYFAKLTSSHWVDYLSRECRDMAFRQARADLCIACQAAISINSTRDHLIPSAKGGPDAAYNVMALCQPCNSSKGSKDLFEWWYGAKRRPLAELPKDIICMYARLMYQRLSAIQLEQPAPDALLQCLREHFRQTQPRLREAIFQSTGIEP